MVFSRTPRFGRERPVRLERDGDELPFDGDRDDVCTGPAGQGERIGREPSDLAARGCGIGRDPPRVGFDTPFLRFEGVAQVLIVRAVRAPDVGPGDGFPRGDGIGDIGEDPFDRGGEGEDEPLETTVPLPVRFGEVAGAAVAGETAVQRHAAAEGERGVGLGQIDDRVVEEGLAVDPCCEDTGTVIKIGYRGSGVG